MIRDKRVQEMLDQLERYFRETPQEEIDKDVKEINDMYPPKEKATPIDMSFVCTDPDCPHCAYDERYVTDGEIEEEAEKQIVNEDLSWEVVYARDAFKLGAKWVRDQYEEINRDNS